ncbi:MAG: M24 family metallopeptidase [Candidatus Hydrogenedentales bacterium]|jgi:Xaa-Pro aminopeptidase
MLNELELFRVRIGLLQVFLKERQYDGVLLSRTDNFAMATAGKRNYVSLCSDLGASSLYVTQAGEVYFVGNNIEETRVIAEELRASGCEIRKFMWFEDAASALVQREFSGTLVSDDGSLGKNVNGEMAYIRSLLTPNELEKYRHLGKLAAETITTAVEQTEVGMVEADIAAILIGEGAKRRCQVPIALIAADRRATKFRHPLPTVAPLLPEGMRELQVRGYVMIILSLLKEGLVVSATRFKRVGDLPERIPSAYDRICGVDALIYEATEPGKTLGQVFADCQQAYNAMDFAPTEWHNHHQGGTTGYAGRTCKAAPNEPFLIFDSSWESKVRDITGIDVAFGQAFAWNPSAPGVKSEDTFLLLPDGTKEVITRTPALPRVDLTAVLGRKTDVVKSGIAEPGI